MFPIKNTIPYPVLSRSLECPDTELRLVHLHALLDRTDEDSKRGKQCKQKKKAETAQDGNEHEATGGPSEQVQLGMNEVEKLWPRDKRSFLREGIPSKNLVHSRLGVINPESFAAKDKVASKKVSLEVGNPARRLEIQTFRWNSDL